MTLAKVRKNAVKLINNVIMNGVTVRAYNQSNDFSGEEIQPDYKLKKSVIEDIELGHAKLYFTDVMGHYKLIYNSNCWWEITL